MKKTNFDVYLEERLKEPEFVRRYKQAGKAWDIALQKAVPGKKARPSERSAIRKASRAEKESPTDAQSDSPDAT